MNFLFVKETPISSCSRKNQKKFQQHTSGKAPSWLLCRHDFPLSYQLSVTVNLILPVLKPFLSAFYSFSFAVVAFFRLCHGLTYCCWQNRFVYRKSKSSPFVFFCFSVFQFSSHKVRFSCVLLAWIVNIPFHHIVTVRISKPTSWVARINYWIKWKVVNLVSRLRL